MSRTLTEDALARIARLELEARETVEGFLTGQHRSPYFGQSLEFAQHRKYAPGDDIRRIDWKVLSKTDKVYLKQYEEETNLRTTLVIDASESMRFGGETPGRRQRRDDRGRTKFDQACRIAAALSYLLLRQQDSVGALVFDSGVRSRVPHRAAHTHLQTILEALATEEASSKTDFAGVLKEAADGKTGRGLVVLISDLFVDLADLKRGLELLRVRGHEVIVFHVMDEAELTFEFAGTTKFVGLEGAGELTCDPRSLRAGYLRRLSRFLEDAGRTCSRAGADYALVRTGDRPSAPLAAFLARRSRTRRR